MSGIDVLGVKQRASVKIARLAGMAIQAALLAFFIYASAEQVILSASAIAEWLMLCLDANGDSKKIAAAARKFAEVLFHAVEALLNALVSLGLKGIGEMMGRGAHASAKEGAHLPEARTVRDGLAHEGVEVEPRRAHEKATPRKESEPPRSKAEEQHDRPLTELQKDALAYARDIEAQTGAKLHPKQVKRLAQELREHKFERLSPAATKKHRRAFRKEVKDQLIKQWESETGQEWPRYSHDVHNSEGVVIRKKGQYYDAHHVIENSYGGPHEWWNIHPAAFPDEHQLGIHRPGGAAEKIFP